MRNIILFLLISSSLSTIAQEKLDIFNNLMDSKWLAQGNWENGEDFKQEYIFSKSLNDNLVRVQTYGTTNMLTGEYGIRNEGIRVWDEAAQQIKFYEFDVFGGITEGRCVIAGQSVFYEYLYEGLTLRDAWNYVDENTYELAIYTIENGAQKELFLKCQVIRVDE